MEKQHIIERKNLNGNRRSFHIFLTDYGMELSESIEKAFLSLEQEIFSGISNAEKEQFLKIFEKLYKNTYKRGVNHIMEKLKRYIIFFIGLYINSLGVALITKASLGTSPISSIPYVLSLNFPFTLGNFTIFFSLLLIFLQLLILRKNFKLEHVLQIPISILFGYFIDWSMILLGFVNPCPFI